MDQRRIVDLLTNKIDKLIRDYDLYFQGIITFEPVVALKDIDRMVRQIRPEQVTNTGLRFRYKNQVARLNTYRQLWNRKIQKMELENISPIMKNRLIKEKISTGQETL